MEEPTNQPAPDAPETEAEALKQEEQTAITRARYELARLLHESARRAVAEKKIYRDDVPVKPFCEWADLPEPAREGYLMMADYLVANGAELMELILVLTGYGPEERAVAEEEELRARVAAKRAE